jgi:hypothetical protein
LDIREELDKEMQERERKEKKEWKLEKRNFESLCSQKLRGHSFCTFHNSMVSNFSRSNYKAITVNEQIKFVLRARTGTL